jgi:hypothetical protein
MTRRKATEQVIRGRISEPKRLTNSANGNPRFDLLITSEDGTQLGRYKTKTDAACNYEVTNYTNSGDLVDIVIEREHISMLKAITA